MNKELIYDWNTRPPRRFDDKSFVRQKRIELNDETLRDGLQATYVQHPTLEDKITLIDRMEDLGIESANLGFPNASPTQFNDIVALGKHIRQSSYEIKMGVGGRVLVEDVQKIIESARKIGEPIEAGLFVASSTLRYFVEQWDIDAMCKNIAESVSLARKYGLPVMFVTEDTTRAHPETIKRLYSTAIENGAERLCVCDTVGHANHRGTNNLITFFRETVTQGDKNLQIDWHGHNDRGLATSNALEAAIAGADRIQATALGVGERAGNTSMVELLTNLQLEGLINRNLSQATCYAKDASRILQFPLRDNDPVVGDDVFTTGTGPHAAAIVKARGLGSEYSEIVYSSIDPSIVGKKHDIRIGPMSGHANALWALQELGIQPQKQIIDALLNEAKSQRKLLSQNDIWAIAYQLLKPE